MKGSNGGGKASHSTAAAGVVAVAAAVAPIYAVVKPMKDVVAVMPYPDLMARKEDIQARLQVIAIEPIKAKKPTAASAASAANNTGNTSNSNSKKKGRSAKQSPSKASADTHNSDNNNQQVQEACVVPMVEKTSDVHWDFTMKEMMWLATDFQGERKRQMSLAKKLAGGMKQYHKTRESRRLRELAEAELKRRRLGAKIGREVKGWWTKIERVIAYKQKCSADEERRQAMNKQLVTLVKQTEKYTESLIRLPNEGGDDDDNDLSSGEDDSSYDEDVSNSNSSDEHQQSNGKKRSKQRNSRKRRRRRSTMTIEEALAVGERSRRSKNKVVDYNRLHLQKGDDHLYGESTASDTGSDGSFSLEESDGWTDDETTLLEAEELETKERQSQDGAHQERKRSGQKGSSSFTADPRELSILEEERDMPIGQVLERYRNEMESTNLAELAGSADAGTVMSHANGDNTDEGKGDATQDDITEVSPGRQTRNSTRKVTFAASAPRAAEKNGAAKTRQRSTALVAAAAAAKYDADDDGDASDVEDFVDLLGGNRSHGGDDSDGGGSDEFEADQDEVDDETTMAQEERLPQALSAREEIDLLNAENEMSVEELRKMYAGALFQDAGAGSQGMEESQPAKRATRNGAKAAPVDVDDSKPEAEKNTRSTRTARRSTTIAAAAPAPAASANTEPSELEQALNAGDDEGGEEDFVPPAGADMDDETTMEAEERLGRDLSYEQELKLLQDENEIPVDQLRAMYASALTGNDDSNGDEDEPPESDDDSRLSVKRHKAGDSYLADAFLGTANQEDVGDEDDFEPEAGEGVDDETTMEAEERLGRDMSYEDEIALLNHENDMSVEELRAKYVSVFVGKANGDDSKRSISRLASSALMDDNGSDVGDDTEFVAEEIEVDDETTMEAEEHMGREMSPEDELAMLQRENETPIESLYEMYQKMEQENQEHASEATDEDSSETGSASEPGAKRKRASHPDQDDNTKRAKTEEESDEGLAAIEALEESAERARKTLASRPFLIAPWVQLRAYQQIGLNWLVSLQTHRLNGILADEMGLGKTLQTIALLGYLAAYKGIWGPHLVIVPTSVLINWETELKRFCPGLKALTYYGSAKRRKELRTGWTKTNWYNVVITSYQLAVQDAFAFKRKRWYYLILDEAQNIKNFQSQRWQTLINFNTQRRLLLTGTPLQNNLMELWSLLHFLMPYIFRSRKEFSFWFSNPMNSMIDGTANQNDEMIARLHGIIRPFLLRRLKKDVETQLPGKYEHIVKCPLSRRQMFFYEEFMARSSTRQALKKGGNYMGMMNVLMQLRKVCNHPDLFEPRSVITPFVLKQITMRVPECVVGIINNKHVFSRLSQHLLSPLWCGSFATPSIAAGTEHDEVRSMALRELEDRAFGLGSAKMKPEGSTSHATDIPLALSKLLKELDEKSNNDRKATVEFQRNINSLRCGSPPFPCSTRRLQTLIRVPQHPIYQKEEDFLSTPSQLLTMRRNHQDRAEDVDEMLKHFVFCVPKAGAARPALETRKSDNDTETLEEMLLEPLEVCLRPFRQAQARLTSFFPDKKLVQFDAGKLQTLSELLHDLKRGGHRVLIFTQMSKMLDILEAFLNLNGHTYVRLDGSTGVDRRQRLMDRFNNDEKIFSFILSTRSGGMGINLTGADTVIFYDSDWNPAMDAQAQDRAHRIGQTRDVHIYRLITEHSIEENILVKAQQKRNLDILVMDKGKFDGSSARSKTGAPEKETKQEDQSDVFTKGGLRAILGVDGAVESKETEDGKDTNDNLTKEQIEAAMTNLEDQDDVLALRGAQKEAKEELQEFDESIELKGDTDNEGGDDDADNKGAPKAIAKKKEEAAPVQKTEEDEMAKEFAAWQDNVGVDASALEASLSPTETYALNFRQDIDPFYSMFAVLEERRRIEASMETKDEIDIDQIEHEKAIEERRAIDDGDLLATRPRPEDLVRQRNLYEREKARLKASKKRRALTGENWEVREDARNNKPYWYNTDTGEALWDKPTVLLELEAEELARQMLWPGLPLKPLVNIMSFLVPHPDRISCTQVCRQWRLAATDISFVRHVYPVEMGALVQDKKHLGHNHYRTIAEAISVVLPGDTIELGDGHYWVNEPGVSIKVPLKFIGDENNASNVVIELSGTITWSGRAGWVEGVTFRRPKISSGEGSTDDMLRILDGGRVDLFHSVIDNTGSSGASAIAVQGSGNGGRWQNVIVSGGCEQGIKLDDGAKVEMTKCTIRGNRGNGIVCNKSEVQAIDSRMVENGGYAAIIRGGAARFVKCHFDRNATGILRKEDGCKVNCNHNTAPASDLARQNIPGFQASGKNKTRD